MNNGKPELSYLLHFPTAVEGFSRVKMLGAVKYEYDNWKKGGKPDREYLDACLRHLTAFVSGELYAEDSGCSHLSHAAWNLFALLELNYKGQSHDPERFEEMMQFWEAKRREKDETLEKAIQDGDIRFEILDAERCDSLQRMLSALGQGTLEDGVPV